MPGQGANFAHKDALAHLLEAKRGGNMIHVGFFRRNQVTVNLTDRLNQEIRVGLTRAAIEVFQLRLQIGETGRQVHAEPMQDGEVDAVHVAGPTLAH